MTLLLKLCWRAYEWSLLLYPAALRRDFGVDMSDLFRQQTTYAWYEGGWSAVRPLLWYSVREIFTEALPAVLGSQGLMAGAISLVCTSAAFWCLLWALSNPLAVKAMGDRLHWVLWHNSGPVSQAHNRRRAFRSE